MSSCLDKKPTPILPIKTLDVVFRRRYLPNTQYYFTNRKHALDKVKGPQKRTSPFLVPRSEKLLSYIKYSDRKEKIASRQRLSQPLHKKDNLRIAATRDMSKRLFIEEPPDDVRAVVEIHPEFYTVIEGRPLRSHDDIKVYVNNIRNYAMYRQQIGYRRDLILKVEQGAGDEGREHDKIVYNYKQHVKNFQRFLTEDYKKACAKVTRTEQVYAELVSKSNEFLSYISKVTLLNNVIFKLDAIRGILKMYRTYLLFVAPLSWRQRNDETLRGKIQSIQFEAGEFMTDNDLVESLDIDKMIELAGIELRNPLPAKLYFKTPEEMMYLFRTMEMQSREYLTEMSKTDGPYRMLQDRMKQLKQSTIQELDYFQYYIESIKKEIAREEYNENFLQEKFYRILNGCFYDSVASPDTLELKICVEYVYEQIFGKCEEGHQCIRDPMKILEVTYEDYNLKLDALDFKIVTQAQKDFFAQDLRMMNNAYKAQRELKAFKEMTNAMNKAFYPPAEFRRPDISKKSGKDAHKNTHDETGEPTEDIPKIKLTADELEGIMLFTEWCEGMDPTPYLKEYYEYVKPTFDFIPVKTSMDS